MRGRVTDARLGDGYEAGQQIRAWVTDTKLDATFTTVASFLITLLVCTIQHVIYIYSLVSMQYI